MPQDGEIRKVGSILYYWDEGKQQWVARSDAPVPAAPAGQPEAVSAATAPAAAPARRRQTAFGRYLRDPWTRTPITEVPAIGDVREQLSRGVRGRTNLEKEMDLRGGFDRAGAQVTRYGQRIGVQRGNVMEPILTPEQQEQQDFQQKIGQREVIQGQEQAWQQTERARQKEEFRTNVESAMELVDTAQIAPDSPAWAVQNDMKQAYDELQQLQRYAAHGANPARLKPKIAGLRERIASGAMRLQIIQGEMQKQEDLEKGVEIDPATGKRTTTVEREHKQALDFRKEDQVAKVKEQQLDNRRALYQFKMDRAQQQVQFRTKQVENLLKKQVDAQTALADAKDEASRAEKTIPTATAKKGETPEQAKARAATEHAVSVQEAKSAQLSAEQSLANIDKLIGDAQRAADEAEQRLMTAMNDMEREINRQVGIEQQPVAPGAGEQPKTVETMSDDELAAHLRANIGDAAAMAEAKRRRGR